MSLRSVIFILAEDTTFFPSEALDTDTKAAKLWLSPPPHSRFSYFWRRWSLQEEEAKHKNVKL